MREWSSAAGRRLRSSTRSTSPTAARKPRRRDAGSNAPRPAEGTGAAGLAAGRDLEGTRAGLLAPVATVPTGSRSGRRARKRHDPPVGAVRQRAGCGRNDGCPPQRRAASWRSSAPCRPTWTVNYRLGLARSKHLDLRDGAHRERSADCGRFVARPGRRPAAVERRHAVKDDELAVVFIALGGDDVLAAEVGVPVDVDGDRTAFRSRRDGPGIMLWFREVAPPNRCSYPRAGG